MYRTAFLAAGIIGAALATAQGGPEAGSWGAGSRRGANVGMWLRASDLQVLASWGADHVRLQILSPYLEEADGRVWFKPESEASLVRFLQEAEQVGLAVVVDCHAHGLFFPDDNWRPEALERWRDPQAVAKLADFCRHLARLCRGNRTVIGYDLLNEPHPPYSDEGYQAWNRVAEHVTRAIREVDQVRTVVIGCASYANPGGMAKLEPVSDPNVVYSFHMYLPHEFTEQGTRPQWPAGQVYPGTIGLGWDEKTPTQVEAAWLRESVKAVVEFQRRHAARIWVGEFSARRDAPQDSALRYLSDVLALFDEQGWDWAYHAFRESSTWDLELPANPEAKKRQGSTPRLELLRSYWKRGE